MRVHFLQPHNSGFALLLTMVVVSVMLAIGLTLLDITIKQVVLSGTGRDSEIAFHAAYAGAECAQYWRLNRESDFLSSPAPTLEWCMGSSVSGTYTSLAGGLVHLSQYEITWGDASDRCTQIDLYMYDATAESSPVTYDIPNFGSGTESCDAGSLCTIHFSRGYNRACSEINSFRTVQREVVLQY